MDKQPKTIYEVPPAEMVDQFVKLVGKGLQPEIPSGDILNGLAAFIKLAAAISAKFLNQKS